MVICFALIGHRRWGIADVDDKFQDIYSNPALKAICL